MIITRTPLRISFFGGGTDFPEWYEKNENAGVISTSINKYNFINIRSLPPFFKYKHIVRYYKREEVMKISSIKHPSVRECLKHQNIKQGIEIVHHADVPALSGLGSSSSFTVGLLNGLCAFKGENITKKELSYRAIKVERSLIKEKVGCQDQTVAAFGGFNHIKFKSEFNIEVNPIAIKLDELNYFQSNLFLIFTDFQRNASDIEKSKLKNLNKIDDYLLSIREIKDEAYTYMSSNKKDFDKFGKLLNEQWKIKKLLSNKVSNKKLDDIYNFALSSGSIGGKLLGAGGGGFFIFYVKKNKHKEFREKMKKFLIVPFKFDFTGSQVIYYSHT